MNLQEGAQDDLTIRGMIARQQREFQELTARIQKDQRSLKAELATLLTLSREIHRDAERIERVGNGVRRAALDTGGALDAHQKQAQAQTVAMKGAGKAFAEESAKAADRLRKERWWMSATSVFFTAIVMVLIITALTVLAPGWSMTLEQRQAHDFGADILEVWWEMPEQERAEIESMILREVLRQGKLHLLN